MIILTIHTRYHQYQVPVEASMWRSRLASGVGRLSFGDGYGKLTIKNREVEAWQFREEVNV